MAPDTANLMEYPLARPAACPFDPAPEYRSWLQVPGPQQVRLEDGTPAWVLTRYEDIRAALSDPTVSAYELDPGMPPLVRKSATKHDEVSFVRLDDPEHAQHRRMVTADFTIKRAEKLRPRIQQMADEFLDRMIAKGAPADLVKDYALPIPSTVIGLILGVPDTDHEFFQAKSQQMLDLNLPPEESAAAHSELLAYVEELMDRKEREPEDDLISRLMTQRVATGEISRSQIPAMVQVLLVAGHDTTAGMIALSTITLLQHPDQLARLRDTDDPALIARAVEELLRYITIAENVLVRVATQDITIGGRLVRAGEGLIINPLAGNRDSSFAADPDTFDIDRNARGHLSFGYGVHQCVGQNLSRVELSISLPTLLRRLPGLRLAAPVEEIPFRAKANIYGVERLPVEW
ncbi:cytochrome P450 [Streptomyces sp. Root369]|uniref:cytochrome P450 n=2 Tax=unclassified Streptomyces TaxID=2593676 RepID=UPI0007107635|nr:cytochrome P450 [Streptomyces sp. Root369]KQV94132.1 cytochrome [Streptomyces sp. Root369]